MTYYKRLFAILIPLLICLSTSISADNMAYVQQIGEPHNTNIGCQIIQIGDDNLINGSGGAYTSVSGSSIARVGILMPAYQGGSGALNDFVAVQTGYSNTITLNQWAYFYNDAYIDQDGNGNILVGAKQDPEYPYRAVIDESSSATQIISTVYDNGYNELTVEQNGDDNSIGLYQYSNNYNTAEFHQTGDDNQSAVCQINNGSGYNNIFVDQNDGDRGAMIYQETFVGNNEVYYVSP
ncbi:hypothetical protein GF312_03100 [Candidatus Poribacteria bacterium]|nr:hypothetical protein [Candidatus Poribacteria bacterium]